VSQLSAIAYLLLISNHGTAVGQNGPNGIILRTTNGGTDWIQVTSPTTNELIGVFFSDTSTGTAVGKEGTI
jgi:photosystem II stability/assembly factor-like uncharacterized protein